MPEEAPNSDQESAIERLRSRLYSPNTADSFATPSLSKAPPPGYGTAEVPVAWTPPTPPKQKRRISWTILFFGIALIFFVVAGGLSYFFLSQGTRTVSSDNITISLPPPASIVSGSVVPLVVTIKNDNPAPITDTDISIDFPDGTRSADDMTQPLLRYPDSFGTIPAGGSVSRTVQAVLFGTAGQNLSIPVTITYHTPNSNAAFTKQQTYTLTVTSAPLTISAKSVSTISVGQPFTIALAVQSNATTPLQNIAVMAALPNAFKLQSVSGTGLQKGSPTTGSLFTIGTLAPGEEKDFTITGTLSGSENDQQAFLFTVGTPKTDGTQTLSVAYASQSTNVTITKPFLSTTLSINHDISDPTVPTVISAGQQVAGQVAWSNTLSTPITNAKVTVKLLGTALDPASVGVTNGFYDSSTNSITYSGQSEPSLASLNPGDTGVGTFSFGTKSGTALTKLRNPIIQLAVSVTGQPGSGAAETISNSVTSTIRIATDLEFTSRLVHSVGPFKDTGIWPPVANQPTTYTVLMSLTNTVNSVGGATATMILPQYVTFTGQTSPSDGSISYDETSRTVTWKVADVPAGTGIPGGTAAITGAFQISFTPSVTQKGSTPILVGNQTVTGVDRFTTAQIGDTAEALTTEANTDPAYQPTFGIVAN